MDSAFRFALLAVLVASPGLAQSPASPPASPPAAAYQFDPLFPWYEAESHSSSRNGRPVDEGYTLKVRYRVFGQAIPGTFFRVEVRRAPGGRSARGRPISTTTPARGRPLAEWRCSASPHGTYLYTPSCLDRAQKLTHVGGLLIDVYFHDGQSEQRVARHLVRVDRVTRVRGSGERDAPRYHVDYATEMHEGVLELAPRGESYLPGGRMYGSENRLALFVTLKRAPDAPRMRGASVLRCEVDGTAAGVARVEIEEMNTATAVETRMRGGQMERTDHRWVRYRLGLPIAWGEGVEGRNDLLPLRPGAWRCAWQHQGELLRGFRFQVDDALVVQPNPESAQLLSLPPGLVHVDLERPARTPIDASPSNRSAGANTAFWGQTVRLGRAAGNRPCRTCR